MIKEELSVSEEEEEETAPSSAVGGAEVKKPPEQTVESDPLPTFVNQSSQVNFRLMAESMT